MNSSPSTTSPTGGSNAAPAKLPLAARRHGVVTAIEHALTNRVELPHGSPVLVAVSGGADSLALLIGLTIIAQRRDVADRIVALPVACHVHHHLRPATQADADAEHVRAVCERLGVACEIEHVHPGDQPGNIEANARQLRYASLSRIAQQRCIGWVATGHHAQDQLETMLMAMCRGAGPDGLAGIRWRRAMNANDPDGVQLVRPLLGVTHDDCRSLCEAAEITWREDASNDDVTGSRNRVRHDVMPILEERWHGAAERSRFTGDLMTLCASLLNERLDDVFGSVECQRWARDTMRIAPGVLIAAAVRRAAVHVRPAAADHLGSRLLSEIADAIASKSTHRKQFDLPGGLVLRITADGVSLDDNRE